MTNRRSLRVSRRPRSTSPPSVGVETLLGCTFHCFVPVAPTGSRAGHFLSGSCVSPPISQGFLNVQSLFLLNWTFED